MLPNAYNLQLRAPKPTSPEWYKRFHDRYYLFVLVNLLLLSYLRSFVVYTKKDGRDEAIANDIRDFLEEIIKKEIKFQNMKEEACLVALGLQLDSGENKEININLDDLLNLTSGKDWYEVVKGLLNSWEFMCLYTTIETTFKEILNEKGRVKEEELLSKLFEEYKDLEEKLKDKLEIYNRSFCENMWKFYTRIRNVYSHSSGFITSTVRNGILGGLRAEFIEVWRNIDDSLLLLLMEDSVNDSFSSNKFVQGKIYLMSDHELNIFRTFTVHIAESLEELSRT